MKIICDPETYKRILRMTHPESNHPRRYPWWQYPYRLFDYLRYKYVFYPRFPAHARRDVEDFAKLECLFTKEER